MGNDGGAVLSSRSCCIDTFKFTFLPPLDIEYKTKILYLDGFALNHSGFKLWHGLKIRFLTAFNR